MAELGVFLIPPPDHPFYALASGVLGYDIWAQRRLSSTLMPDVDRETAARWLGPATGFGIHCTIGGAALSYDDADIPEIKDRLAWIGSRTPPFTLGNGHFLEQFRSDPHVLMAVFESPDGAIQRLHRQVVTTVSPLYTSSKYASYLPRLNERERELYVRTGEPWVLDGFVPHWSLLSRLTTADARKTARALLSEKLGLFADERTRTLAISDVHLVRRAEDGYCTVIGSFPLTGAC
jgi:hypothetical protein